MENCPNIEYWMKASVLSERQCRLWRRAAVKDILFECYIVWNSQCLKKLSEQWDLELFSLGLSSLSVRKEARGGQPAISGAVAAGLRLSSLGTMGFYPGYSFKLLIYMSIVVYGENEMENSTNTILWTMEEVNLLKFKESDSLCWFSKKCWKSQMGKFQVLFDKSDFRFLVF